MPKSKYRKPKKKQIGSISPTGQIGMLPTGRLGLYAQAAQSSGGPGVDNWQLEENTDAWLLEDGSGVWLLE